MTNKQFIYFCSKNNLFSKAKLNEVYPEESL